MASSLIKAAAVALQPVKPVCTPFLLLLLVCSLQVTTYSSLCLPVNYKGEIHVRGRQKKKRERDHLKEGRREGMVNDIQAINLLAS